MGRVDRFAPLDHQGTAVLTWMGLSHARGLPPPRQSRRSSIQEARVLGSPDPGRARSAADADTPMHSDPGRPPCRVHPHRTIGLDWIVPSRRTSETLSEGSVHTGLWGTTRSPRLVRGRFSPASVSGRHDNPSRRHPRALRAFHATSHPAGPVDRLSRATVPNPDRVTPAQSTPPPGYAGLATRAVHAGCPPRAGEGRAPHVLSTVSFGVSDAAGAAACTRERIAA